MSRRGRPRRSLRRLARVALTLAVLGGLGAGTLGVPVVPPGLGGDFPCQGHGCGCRSAEDCWLGCCCLTPAQRLAWANERGVTPPAGLVELAKLQPDAPKKRRPDPSKPDAPKKKSCCSGHGTKACCRPGGAERKSCCGGAAAATKDRRPEPSPEPSYSPMRCRGLAQSWMIGGQPLGLPERGVSVSENVVSTPVITASVEYAFLVSPPPTRPG